MQPVRIKSLSAVFAVAAFLCLPVPGAALDIDNELDRGVTDGCAPKVTAPAPNSRPAADAIKVLPPQNDIYFGTYQIPTGPRDADRFGSAIGAYPPIVFSFHDFFSDTNGSKKPDKTLMDPMEGDGRRPNVFQMAEHLNSKGSVLALAWAVYCCDYTSMGFWMRTKKPYKHFNRILAGEVDGFLRESARQIKDYGKPLMLTIIPEYNWQGSAAFGENGRKWIDAVDNICNQYGDPTWPDGPERVRDVFRYVIDLFREEGVKNVTWFMYAATNYMSPDFDGESIWLHPQYYYPGDDYIDWVGQSVYFTDPQWVGKFEEVGTFEQAFGPGYKAIRSVTDKPIILTEFGPTSEPNQSRGKMWTDLLTTQLKGKPGVKAITIADTMLFEDYFSVPMLSTRPTEVNMFKSQAAANGYSLPALRLSR